MQLSAGNPPRLGRAGNDRLRSEWNREFPARRGSKRPRRTSKHCLRVDRCVNPVVLCGASAKNEEETFNNFTCNRESRSTTSVLFRAGPGSDGAEGKCPDEAGFVLRHLAPVTAREGSS